MTKRPLDPILQRSLTASGQKGNLDIYEADHEVPQRKRTDGLAAYAVCCS
jgi:hypothetical protein